MNDAAAPAIQIERPVIATDDGHSFDGYLARPTNERGPGLVIFSEMWGVAPSKTEMAEDYAKRGWCACAPVTLNVDLAARVGPKPSFGSIQSTCLSALVTDWAMETWYHRSIA
jgi:dienelactone hydrolase